MSNVGVQAIPIRVEFTARWLAPQARLTVAPRDAGAPLNAHTVRYVKAVESWLQQECWPLLSETNAAGLRAWKDDLEAIVRGKLLKAAFGDIKVAFPISEEDARTTPVCLTDPQG
jgi:hypothetical protein